MSKSIELLNTRTGIYWWNETRHCTNKAIKAHNKFIQNEISISKFEKKVKKSYQILKKNNYCVDYSNIFDTMITLLNDNNVSTKWYKGF